MAKPKRKSVSFEKHLADAPENTKQEGADDSKQFDPQLNLPQFKNKLLAIPFHNLLVLVGMFQLGLLDDITGVLLKSFLTLIPIQIGYDYILLLNLKKKKKDSSNVPLLIASSIVVSILLAIPLYILLVLFGAPFLSYNLETGLLCLHLSMLAFNPLLVIFKFDFRLFAHLFQIDKIYKTIFANPVLSASLMALIGTWFGVLPIPLDWDRPWQQWPITLVVGVYVGSISGSLVSLVF